MLNNHLEIYKVLPKTNCRKCGAAACLAFAVSVMQGAKTLADCPYLDKKVLKTARVNQDNRIEVAEEFKRDLTKLQDEVKKANLAEAAKRADARFIDGKLTVKCMGKDFSVDQNGVITSQCHVNLWLSAPILSYILHCAGREPVGEWLPLRDLKGGDDWMRLFGQRCEQPLQRVIDGYTDLMADIIDILDGRPAPEMFDSDLAVIIQPLPKLPVLLCYWEPEDGLESSMHMFFDRSATDNLKIDYIYTLCVGLVTMFEKMAITNGP
jgi:hypothetical protein